MQKAELLDIEKLVKQLDGILSAKLVADDDGNLTEIHILSNKNKSPKQLSRDIQSAVSAALGCSINHEIISIAQIDDCSLNSASRLKIAGLQISYSGSEFCATVTLGIDEKLYEGISKCATSSCNRPTEVAKACLNAVNNYLGSEAICFCDIQKLNIANLSASNVAVSYCDSRGNEKMLTGSAVIQDDEYMAAIRAALDAVNRILPQIR